VLVQTDRVLSFINVINQWFYLYTVITTQIGKSRAAVLNKEFCMKTILFALLYLLALH